jgi:hypothetical protein
MNTKDCVQYIDKTHEFIIILIFSLCQFSLFEVTFGETLKEDPFTLLLSWPCSGAARILFWGERAT